MPNHPEKEVGKSIKNDDLRLRIKQLVAGGLTGAITKSSVAPLERAKILLQIEGMTSSKTGTMKHSSPLKYNGLLNTIYTIIKDEGFLALYRGNGANVLRVIPVYALKFTFNDVFTDIWKADKTNPKHKLTFSQLIISGTCAGLFQTCITYPLETVRTRLSMGKGLGASYDGIADVFVRTIKTEGISGLYKGLGPTLVTGSPYVGLQMSGFELLLRERRRIGELIGTEQKYVVFLYENCYLLFAGALAGITAQTLTYPGDTVRRRMQTNGMLGKPKVYKNSVDCFTRIIRQEGVRKLYAGLSANLVRAIPGAAIQFWAYDFLKKSLGIYKKRHD